MAAKTKQPPPRRRPSKAPALQPKRPRPSWQYLVVLATAPVVVLIVVALMIFDDGGKTSSVGLPHTADYHSLLVSPTNPRSLTLGTHDGLYESLDGGRHWRRSALRGDDAMGLARATPQTIWLAGHDVLKKSYDGGQTWRDVRPSGLPGLDVHAFAADPRNPNTIFAAIAGQGLYRSRDGGSSFSLFSQRVGGGVMALAIMPDGRVLAGDMREGLLESGDGESWRQTLRAQLMGLAVNPRDPRHVLATGGGIALSTNGGRTWRSMLDLKDGAGPVAWSASNPQVAYVVGFDRVLYRSRDGGKTWRPVTEG